MVKPTNNASTFHPHFIAKSKKHGNENLLIPIHPKRAQSFFSSSKTEKDGMQERTHQR
jgi:hypothetical protein